MAKYKKLYKLQCKNIHNDAWSDSYSEPAFFIDKKLAEKVRKSFEKMSALKLKYKIVSANKIRIK